MNLKSNFTSGVTAAIIALPLSLAFGVASGLGAAAGIYGAIILGFFASLFGGTPTQISGPTGPMTVVVAAAVLTLHNDMNSITTVILLSGVFQILFGIAKIGKYVRYIPYPVISGFMSGIGIIIIILQINPFLGQQSDASIIHILLSLGATLSNTNLQALILSILTLIIMFFTPNKISKHIPTPLIALLLLTPLSMLLNFNIQTIGEIPTTLPDLVLPNITTANYKVVLSLGFTLAVLGTIDTLLTSIVADSITQTKHKPNKELIGQGIGNALCSLIGAVPGAGATMRTVINVKSGGTNNISGMIHSLTLLAIVLFLAPIASKIPLAVLSGILIKVGVDILDYRFLKIWKNSPKQDLTVMVSVFIVTVFIDLITAVGVGIVLSSLLVVHRITQATQVNLTNTKDTNENIDITNESVRIIKIDGAFFFGSAIAFEEEANTILDTKIIIIDISNVPFIDITAIFTLIDFISKMKDSGIEVIISTNDKYKTKLLKFNNTNVFDDIKFTNNINEAIQLTQKERVKND